MIIMKRNYNFKHLEHYQEILDHMEPLEEASHDDVVETDPSQALLKMIYSIGSDGWPVGDLAYFVGKNSNPEVQRFILENLMRDVSSVATPASMDLDDATITLLTRQSGESRQQYAARLNNSIDKDKFIINAAQQSIRSEQASKDKTSE